MTTSNNTRITHPPLEDEVQENHEFQSKKVVTLSIAHWIHDTYTGFLPAMLPDLITRLAISKTQAGLLTFYIQGPSLLQPLIGHIADKVSLRYLVILAPTIVAILMTLIGITPTYLLVSIILLVVGVNSASLHAVAPAMAGYLSGKQLGKGMGFWMVGGELGRTLGPIIVVTAVGFLTYKGLPLLTVFGVLASIFLYIRLKDVSGKVNGIEHKMKFNDALVKMKHIMLPILAIVAAVGLMRSAITTFLAVYLTEHGASFWLAGASLTLVEAAGVFGALLGGSISDKIGRRMIVLLSLILTPPLLFFFIRTDGWLQIVILLLLGFTALSIYPVFMAISQECCPGNRALANGVYNSISFAVGSGAGILLGVLGDAYGLQWAYNFSVYVILLGIPFVFMLPDRVIHKA